MLHLDNAKRPAALFLGMLAFLSASLARGQTPITRPVVSEESCPAEVFTVPAQDDRKATAVVRKPPGKGPFPAVIYLRGGLSERPLKEAKQDILNGPTLCRFLAAGYVTVAATYGSRQHDPLTPEPFRDCLAIIEHVKKIPEVDPKSVVLWGFSGGGSLAMELAGEMGLCAVALEEPATVLFSGMFSKENLGGKPPFKVNDGKHIMEDPKRFYTPEAQKLTREKIRKIGCPLFVAHGDVNVINKVNNEILVPELKQAGKKLEVILYRGERHGFSYGGGTPGAAQKFFDDCHTFYKRHLPTQPTPVDKSLVKDVPVSSQR